MTFIYADELKSRYLVTGEFYRIRISGESFLCRRRAEIIDRQWLASQDRAEPLLCSPLNPQSKSIQLPESEPHAVAILMNPGSARRCEESIGIPELEWIPTRPASEVLSRLRLEEVKPDNTQYQLMRLMKRMNWPHLRLINLSDICNANSADFAKVLKQKIKGRLGWPWQKTLSSGSGMDNEEADSTAPADLSQVHSCFHPIRQEELEILLRPAIRIAAWGTNRALDSIASQAAAQVPGLIGLPLEFPGYRFASPYRKDQKLRWLEDMQVALYQSG